MFAFLCHAGLFLGASDEGPEKRCEAEEGARTPIQPTAHRVPTHSLRNAHGWHPLKALQTPQSHGAYVVCGWCFLSLAWYFMKAKLCCVANIQSTDVKKKKWHKGWCHARNLFCETKESTIINLMMIPWFIRSFRRAGLIFICMQSDEYAVISWPLNVHFGHFVPYTPHIPSEVTMYKLPMRKWWSATGWRDDTRPCVLPPWSGLLLDDYSSNSALFLLDLSKNTNNYILNNILKNGTSYFWSFYRCV